jgi:hypothetical protein
MDDWKIIFEPGAVAVVEYVRPRREWYRCPLMERVQRAEGAKWMEWHRPASSREGG